MASPVAFSGQTTRARSIVTLDGYVSRGKAPANSVPRDHAMLQEFAAYLELRLKCQNLSMLRRIFADFLNEHENTLVPMMQQGCTMITIFPMLRTSAKRRRQAEILLAKPKFHLDTRGCVFLYLQYRTATRNIALLKHLFLEFVCHRETSLLAFVERGCQVISVIPFELPQMRPPPPRVEQHESPRAVETVTEQDQVTETVVKKTRSKKRRAPAKDAAQKQQSTTPASVPAAGVEADAAETQRVVKEPRRSRRNAAKTGAGAVAEVAVAPNETTRRRNSGGDVSTSGSPSSKANADKSTPPASSPVTVITLKRGKKTRTHVVSSPPEPSAVAMEQAATLSHREDGVAAPEEPTAAISSAALAKAETVTKRLCSRGSASTIPNEDNSTPSASSSNAVVVAHPNHTKEMKTSVIPQLQEGIDIAMEQARAAVVPVEDEATIALEEADAVTPVEDEAVATMEVETEFVPEDDGVSRVQVGKTSEEAATAVLPEPTSAAELPEQTSATILSEDTTTAVLTEQASTVEAREQSATVVVPEQTTAVVQEAIITVNSPEHASAVVQEPPQLKRGRKRKSESEKQKSSKVKSHKRGKPAMTEEMIHSQLELARKMDSFVAQCPWEAVYGKLSAPFEEGKHPELSRKFRKFWCKHSRAVWKRKFWAPASRKLNVSEFHKRNNRQLTAKNAFESLIIAVYKEFGAAFFTKLDTQKPRHPGWWYRGPVVSLFALQQLKGEDTMWEYVKNDVFERFPNCKLPLPLASSNSAALRKCDKRESESMWMANHPLTTDILRELAALKEEQQPCKRAMRAGKFDKVLL